MGKKGSFVVGSKSYNCSDPHAVCGIVLGLYVHPGLTARDGLDPPPLRQISVPGTGPPPPRQISVPTLLY